MVDILIVDDEEALCETLDIILSRDGHSTAYCHSGDDALSFLAKDKSVKIVLSDYRMDNMTGIELLEKIKTQHPNIFVILMTAYADWNTSVNAMRSGAYNFISKPFDNTIIKTLIKNAIEAQYHFIESKTTGSSIHHSVVNMIGNSKQIIKIQKIISSISSSDASVLITGESGAGKEVVAKAIHCSSIRSHRKIVSINAGALNQSVLESELFGHIKGSFTGAEKDRVGYFEMADGGTLFLDEIGELPLDMQVKLLRVLETGEYMPVGSSETKTCSVRIVSATNKDLKEMVKEGTFREDLYFRLAIIAIDVPPLRDRQEDIHLLAGYLLSRRTQGSQIKSFSKDALEAILKYRWPGNVRELDNKVQRSIALSENQEITAQDLFGDLSKSLTGTWRKTERTKTNETTISIDALPALEPKQTTVNSVLDKIKNDEKIDLEAEMMFYERIMIKAALEKTNDNLTEAAELLGMTFRQIRYRVKVLGLR